MIRLAAVVAALTLVRLAVAAIVPLAPDETYYWVWSRAMALSYLDHPPMVALWIRAGTSLFGQTSLGVRLFGPLSAALASWFLFDAAERLFPSRMLQSRMDSKRQFLSPTAGVAAVLMLNGTLLLGVGTVIMTPDTPLLFFWIATLWAMVRLLEGGSANWWLAAGLFGGLALDSKYTGLFLWVGIGLWLLLIPTARPWLRRWQPWAAAACGLVLFVPVLWWNAAHGWAGLVKQGNRVDDWQPMRAAGFLIELVGGQIGLATPWIWLLCMAGLIVAIRRSWTQRDPRWALLTALSLPPVLVFLQHAIGDRVQGNWPAIIYPALALAAAGSRLEKRTTVWIGATALGFGITAIVYLQASLDLIPLPPRLDPIALRLSNWDQFARTVDAARIQAGASYVAADGYTTASELAWWLPSATPVVGTDARWVLTNLPVTQIAGRVGVLLRDARRAGPLEPAIWAEAARIGTLSRSGAAVEFAIYRVTAGIALPVAVALPRRPAADGSTMR